MIIYTHTTPTPNAYRRAYWYMQRAAFPDSTAAPRLIPMGGAVNRVNLATRTEGQHWRSASLQTLADLLGWAVVLSLAYGCVAILDLMVNT